jgi:hypothetical protein
VRVLEINYREMAPWAHPLRAAIDATPALAVADRRWRTSNLSDLAFAISTRLGCLLQIIEQIDDQLGALQDELAEREAEVERFLREGISVTFRDYRHVRLALIGATGLYRGRPCVF